MEASDAEQSTPEEPHMSTTNNPQPKKKKRRKREIDMVSFLFFLNQI